MPTVEEIRKQLSYVIDPELGYNIVDLGLVYNIAITPDGDITLLLTLTSPGCPLGDVIEKEIRDKLRLLPGLRNINLTMTFAPPWSPRKSSPELQDEFRLLGIPLDLPGTPNM